LSIGKGYWWGEGGRWEWGARPDVLKSETSIIGKGCWCGVGGQVGGAGEHNPMY